MKVLAVGPWIVMAADLRASEPDFKTQAQLSLGILPRRADRNEIAQVYLDRSTKFVPGHRTKGMAAVRQKAIERAKLTKAVKSQLQTRHNLYVGSHGIAQLELFACGQVLGTDQVEADVQWAILMLGDEPCLDRIGALDAQIEGAINREIDRPDLTKRVERLESDGLGFPRPSSRLFEACLCSQPQLPASPESSRNLKQVVTIVRPPR